jgi:hypothetical protein
MFEFRTLGGTLHPLSGIPRSAASLIRGKPTAVEVFCGASLDQFVQSNPD